MVKDCEEKSQVVTSATATDDPVGSAKASSSHDNISAFERLPGTSPLEGGGQGEKQQPLQPVQRHLIDNTRNISPTPTVIATESRPETTLADGKDDVEAKVGLGEAAGDSSDEPYHILGHRTKVMLMLCVSFMAMVSPMSGQIYYPAVGDIARDLDVSVSLVNLTITTYMIFQGIAPSFVGSFSDVYGRRPAYIFCYTVWLFANIGLALQKNYAALMVLRCLQSTGSSGTVALANAVVSDLVTRAERGRYIGYATLGTMVGPTLGPLIGGVLSQYAGWRSIFWFLAALAAVSLLFTILVMPETCRPVVGNGSIAPPRWNRPVLKFYQPGQGRVQEKGHDAVEQSTAAGTVASPKKRPNPLLSLVICTEKEAGILLLFAGIMNFGLFLTLSTLNDQLAEFYGFNALQIGLCYLPLGLGLMSARFSVGTMIDRNFRRWARKSGLEIVKNRQSDISNFPIEKARLDVQLPMVYFSAAALITFSWVMNFRTHVAGPLVVLVFLGNALGTSSTVLTTLIIDTHKESPAVASAAGNITKCVFGALSTAIGVPMVHALSIGWTGTLVGLLWIALSPLLWLVYFRGLLWRQQLAAKRGYDGT